MSDIEAAFEKHRDKCRCPCDACRLNRRVERVVGKLTSRRDQQFVRTMFREGVKLALLMKAAGVGEN